MSYTAGERGIASDSPSDDPLRPSALLRGIARRWWLVVGLPLAVALISATTASAPPQTVQARLTFAIDIPASALLEGSDEGSAAKVGEALIDDMARIIPGDAFAAAVEERLPDHMTVSAGEIAGSLSADDRHRVSDVTVTRVVDPGSGTEAIDRARNELAIIASAVVDELRTSGASWFARLGADDVVLTIVDGPHVSVLQPTLRQRLDTPLRILLAIAVAVSVALVLHAIDPRIHDAAAATSTARAPLLATIPGRRNRMSIWRMLNR